MLSGELELQIGDERSIVSPGGFAWVPRGTPHTFANAGEVAARGITIATPGGIERMFEELAEYIASTNNRPQQGELDAIRHRHDGATLGPPIRSSRAPKLG
ncbi:MAG: cupin domain-containing protein [Pseudonocardiales bacterium]|nr:cupin domain-containing protein [Pseudonocardiales bacterium]